MQSLDAITSIIQSHFAELKQSGVLDLRPGYKLENDWPTTQPAIVAVVANDAGAVHLPSQVDGIPVDVRRATPVEELAARDPEGVARLAQSRPEFRGGAFEGTAIDPEAEEERGAGKPEIDYTPASVKLKRVTGTFPIVCHASPDAGWPTLRGFIAATQSTLKVSIYDWTSKHILDGVTSSLAASQKLELTLDDPIKNPTADQTDPADGRRPGRFLRRPVHLRLGPGALQPPSRDLDLSHRLSHQGGRARQQRPMAIEWQLEQLQPARHRSHR